MANRVSNEQLEELLDFLGEHPAIAKGVGLGGRSKEAVDKQWNDLANQLNSCGSGSRKTGERWKKYWADLKHKCKARISKKRRDALGTVGGSGSQDDLTEVEKKVLSIIGDQAVFGDSVHKVPIINIKTEIHDEIGPQSENMGFQLIVEQASEAENLTMDTGELNSNVINSPLSGDTIQIVTDNATANPSAQHYATVTRTQQPQQAGLKSHLSRSIGDRPRLRRGIRTSFNTSPSRINLKWVMDLERRRVEAENKLANAALMMAESSRAQAATARVQAEMTGVLVDLIRRQMDDMKALLLMMRPADQL